MARIIQTNVKSVYGFSIANIYTDGSVETNNVYEGDNVTKFGYTRDNKICSVTGRVSKVNLYLSDMGNPKPESIEIDHSAKNNAAVKIIFPDEILECNPTKEVKEVVVKPIIKVNLQVLLSDGSTSQIELTEKKELVNVTILKNGKEIKGNYKLEKWVYMLGRISSQLKVVGMELSGDSKEKVSFDEIKVCGAEGMVIDKTVSITDALASVASDEKLGGLILPVNTYSESLTLGNSVSLIGAKDVPANTGSRCVDEIISGETTLANLIGCEAGSDVTIQGVTMTENALMTIGGASSLKLKNCRYLGVTGDKAKSYLLLDKFGTNDEGTLLQIEGCYFGSNDITSANKMYNLFEVNSKLADGSYIKNCYFAKEACTHNIINIYDVMPGATITIENNVFEMSANAIRVGTIGDAECKIVIKNNTYLETDSLPDWQGILLIQPYGKRTTTMEHVTIVLDGNKGPGEQLYYIYNGANDTKIEGELVPKIYVNGKLQ